MSLEVLQVVWFGRTPVDRLEHGRRSNLSSLYLLVLIYFELGGRLSRLDGRHLYLFHLFRIDATAQLVARMAKRDIVLVEVALLSAGTRDRGGLLAEDLVLLAVLRGRWILS